MAHVTDLLALLLFAALGFTILLRSGFYPAEERSVNLGAEWFYRRGGAVFYRLMDRGLNAANRLAGRLVLGKIVAGVAHFCEAGAARLAALALTPVWMAQGQDMKALEDSRQSLYRRTRRGAFQIGLTACLAVLLLGLLSVIFLFR